MQLKEIGKKILSQDNENHILQRLFGKIDKGARILDVGSGKGRNIKFLNELGFQNVLGVEINQNLVDFSNANNLNAVSVEELSHVEGEFDVVLFSHIIEHFDHNALLDFLECYFSRLKEGGSVIILTPLESNFFYNDFDHVKPYHPQSIASVFSNQLEQVQFNNQFVLDMQDIYLRKMPFRFLVFNRKILLGRFSFSYAVVNIFAVMGWFLTGGLLGRVTGWGARYTLKKK